MAVLPTPYGDRVVPRASRPVAQVSEDAAAAPGRAVARMGNVVNDAALFVQDREDTAAAKERDAYVSDEIRKLLYDPDTGFSNMYGKDAVAARGAAFERLKQLREVAQKDISNGAKRKLDASLQKRIDGAEQFVDRHTGAQRNAWLEGASTARIEAAEQDSLLSGDISQAFDVISGELTQRADREGWDAAKLDVELERAKSGLVYNQALKMANVNPEAALEYVNARTDDLRPSEALKLKAELEPLAKQYQGRRIGREAFGSLGNMSAALKVAGDSLGMNETDKAEALKAYLADGGVSLDPAKTAWCAAYVNATLAQAGMSGTGSNMARSFLNWGLEVSEPKKGDLVVLSRGKDPASGHVGFFEGYDRAGNIRILGGNQNNAVNVSVYPASRVLGYRRAKPQITMPDDAGSKIAEIMQIDDPRVRKAALDEFNSFYAVAENQRKVQMQAATNAAYSWMVEEGNSPLDLDIETQKILGQDAMDSLLTSYNKRTSGKKDVSDPRVYSELRKMQSRDPDAFASANMLEYADSLSTSDLKKFIDEQNNPPSEEDLNSASRLMSVASSVLEEFKIKDNDNGAAITNGLQYRLLKWQDEFFAREGRKPTDTEIYERAASELIPVVRGGADWVPFNEGTTFAIEYALDGAEPVVINGVTIPGDVVAEQVVLIKERDGEVTNESLMSALTELLEGM